MAAARQGYEVTLALALRLTSAMRLLRTRGCLVAAFALNNNVTESQPQRRRVLFTDLDGTLCGDKASLQTFWEYWYTVQVA
jgi:hypothetical protein